MATFTQNFKVVSSKSATVAHPAGSKRKSVEVSFTDVNLQSADAGQVKFACHQLIEAFAKSQFAANSDDWDFVPANLTLADAYQWATTTASKTRAVTAATLKAFADWYEKKAILHLGKTPTAAASGALVIQKKLQPILGNSAAIKVMSQSLIQLAEKIIESGNDAVIEELENHQAVYDWLVENLAEVITVSVNDL